MYHLEVSFYVTYVFDIFKVFDIYGENTSMDKHLEWVQVPAVSGEYIDRVKLNRHYGFVKKHLQAKVARGEKLRVVFYVLYDGMFQAKPLYQLMIKDEMFDPCIVAIPNELSGSIDVLAKMFKTYDVLSQEFNSASDKVYAAFSTSKGFLDFSKDADMICFCTPYDDVTHELYTVKYALNMKALPIMLSYGLFVSSHSNLVVFNLASYNSVWRNFLDLDESVSSCKDITEAHGENVVLTGYSKMDELASIEKKKGTRKNIIIAPHHSILSTDPICLSNFLKYAEFFLELPTLYPNVDFVFRPHPALFDKLYTADIWSQERVEKYKADLSLLDNMELSCEGGYLELFAQSDALIHDCASFVAEYLYTGNPVCYMMKAEILTSKTLSAIGLECLQYHEYANNKEDIMRFIDAVIEGVDVKKEERNKFADAKIKINYPHASQKILDVLKNELGEK